MGNDTQSRMMRIGELARHAGISVRAIRYYEELGLIRPVKRSPGGFRLYGLENHKRLAVINFLKEAGLPLMEIRQILLAKQRSGSNKETVDFLLRVFDERLRGLETRIGVLLDMKSELQKAIGILRSCQSCDKKVLLDSLSCGGCVRLADTEAVPETFRIILH
jgi:DNA-binding transcriptional MerR regulator